MGRWNHRWAPRRSFNNRRYKDYDYEEPPPSPPSPHHPQVNPPLYQEGSEIPWEIDFCKSVHIPWHKVTTAKKFMYCHDSVLAWDDSAGEEAFQNAKQRYWEKISGLPSETPLPDPDMYLDKLDWNPKIDSRLMADIDGIYFNPDEMGRSRKFDTRAENVPNQDLGFDPDDGNNNIWEEGSSPKIIGLNGPPDNLENENNPWEQNSPALAEAANKSAWMWHTDHEPKDNRQWTAGGWKQDGSASNCKQDGLASGWKQHGSASGWKQDGSARGGWKHDGSARGGWNPNGSASGWKQDGSARGGWKQDGLARGGWKHDGSASGWKQDGSARGGWKHDGSARGGWKHDGSSRGGWNQDGSTRGGWKPEGSTRGGWNQDGSTRGGWKPEGSTRGGWKQDDSTRGGWKQEDSTRGGWKQDDSTRGGWDQDGSTNGWKQDASSRGWRPQNASSHYQQNSEDKLHTWHNSFVSNTKAPGNKVWDGKQLTNNFKRSNESESERADQSGYRKREGSFSNSQRYKTSRLEVGDSGAAYRWQEKPYSSDRFNA